MKFQFPGSDVKVRLCERVETKDPQYSIYDVGIQYEDGTIDSLVIPGSGSYGTVKRLAREADERKLANKASSSTPSQQAA